MVRSKSLLKRKKPRKNKKKSKHRRFSMLKKKNSGLNVKFKRFARYEDVPLDYEHVPQLGIDYGDHDYWTQLRSDYLDWVVDAEKYYNEPKVCSIGKLDRVCSSSNYGRHRQYPCLSYKNGEPICYDPQGEYWIYNQKKSSANVTNRNCDVTNDTMFDMDDFY